MSFERFASDKTFASDLAASADAVWFAARWFGQTFNRAIRIEPTRVAPTLEQMSEYADEGDFLLAGPDGAWHRIEVKRRNLDFTSEADYPYPTLIVDVAHAWERASPKPLMYVIFNRDMTTAALISAGTSDLWITTQRMDRGKGRERRFIECDKALAVYRATGRVLVGDPVEDAADQQADAIEKHSRANHERESTVAPVVLGRRDEVCRSPRIALPVRLG